MNYIDYVQLNPFQKFAYKLKTFFSAIPGAIANFFKAVGKVIVAFFVYVSLLGVYSVFVKGNLFESVRSYANYFSIIVIPVATYFVLQKQGGLKERNIKIAI